MNDVWTVGLMLYAVMTIYYIIILYYLGYLEDKFEVRE